MEMASCVSLRDDSFAFRLSSVKAMLRYHALTTITTEDKRSREYVHKSTALMIDEPCRSSSAPFQPATAACVCYANALMTCG